VKRAGVWQQGPGGPTGRAWCGPDGPFTARTKVAPCRERARSSDGKGGRFDAGLDIRQTRLRVTKPLACRHVVA